MTLRLQLSQVLLCILGDTRCIADSIAAQKEIEMHIPIYKAGRYPCVFWHIMSWTCCFFWQHVHMCSCHAFGTWRAITCLGVNCAAYLEHQNELNWMIQKLTESESSSPQMQHMRFMYQWYCPCTRVERKHHSFGCCMQFVVDIFPRQDISLQGSHNEKCD